MDTSENELDRLKKAEYHRGWTDGRKAKEAHEWRLDMDRRDAISRLSNGDDIPRLELIRLLGGDDGSVVDSEPCCDSDVPDVRDIRQDEVDAIWRSCCSVNHVLVERIDELMAENEHLKELLDYEPEYGNVTKPLKEHVGVIVDKSTDEELYCFDKDVFRNDIKEIERKVKNLMQGKHKLAERVKHQREQLAVYQDVINFDRVKAIRRERNEFKGKLDNAQKHIESIENRLANIGNDEAMYLELLKDALCEYQAKENFANMMHDAYFSLALQWDKVSAEVDEQKSQVELLKSQKEMLSDLLLRVTSDKEVDDER